MHGKGERKMAVFEDPNCGYKRFEKDLQSVDNVTIYLYPIILSPTRLRSRAISGLRQAIRQRPGMSRC